ncbi:hypothetical protein CBS101457_003990 [Exobasidium rhododendri]|nr:hypothetical protein CBS101457_003990 [Exobasidium rhododendri]
MADRKSKWDEPGEGSPTVSAEAAAAAAAAAKIAAQFSARAGGGGVSSGVISSASADKPKVDPHDAEFTHDIDINDHRNRYMLTKGQTQTQLHEDTGASVTTKGIWYPDKTLATTNDPPLYLHISATTKEMLDKAIEAVNELIAQDMPQLTEDRHQKRLEYEAQRRAGPPQRREWPEEKILIGLDPLRNFNVRAKVVGPQGLFVKYIQNETGTRVQIKGLGSGFIDASSGAESQEDMHVHITGPDAPMVAEAKILADDLIDAVKIEHEKARQALMASFAQPQQAYGQGGPAVQQGYQQQAGGNYGAGAGYMGQQGGYGEQQQQQQQQQYYPPQPQGAVPPLPDDAPPPPPPEEEAPPPPVEPVKKVKTPEEETLDKYWKDYLEWEKSFKSYHNRLPTTEEGLQDLPAEYRTNGIAR